MITMIYFSPTGNVKYITNKLAEKLGKNDTKILPLEFTEPTELESAEKLIILYSIHAFNPPRTVRRFVKNLPSNLYNSVDIIAVGCAESWINDAASADIKKVLESKGYTVNLTETLAMPLTLIMNFPENVGKETVKNAENRLEGLAKSILNSVKTDKKIALKSKLLHVVGKAEDPAARMFGLELFANSKCTSCGICVNNCPEKNIVFNKKQIPKFKSNCLMCLRCIYECPVQAIKPRFSRFIPIKNSYKLSNFTEV
ncbi:MAG: EFR1 family ferrodoxin [Spirochaetaceae bacterium]